MKNIPELSCAIVEDLLPTYVERLTSCLLYTSDAADE